MKKLLSTFLFSTLLLPTAALYSADPDTVLMFIRDGSRNLELMLEEEVLVMKTMLEEAGYEVEIATVDGTDLVAGDFHVAVNYKLSDVSMDDYGAIALPCMAPPGGAEVEDLVVSLVKAASAANKPIAASRSSVEYLAAAGVLEGRNYAFVSQVNVETRPSFRGGNFTGTATERDGHISTGGICPYAANPPGLPDGTGELTQSLIDSLKARI